MQMDISQRVSSIKQSLAAKSDEKAKGAVRKFIPTSQHVYGVRLPVLNQIAKEHREGGFELAEALWKSGAFEKLLAAKLPGSSGIKDPDRALTLAKKFAAQITDWAVCDTLGMQGVKGIALKKQTELFA
jgi:3-methyladenine DNA glycosylase AlkD